MDADNGGKAPPHPPPLTLPYHHHHHHNHYHHGCHHHFYYISPNCPLHNSILQPSKHSTSCSFSTSYSSLQNPEPFASTETNDGALMARDESEELEFEGEDEPIFVLTDEWRDFFAKSEAKRKQAEAKKQQVKKGKK